MTDPRGPKRSPSTSRACPGRRRRCPMAPPATGPCQDGAVLLFDFGAQVAGYRSDMTPNALRGGAVAVAISGSLRARRLERRRPATRSLEAAVAGPPARCRSGRAIDAVARARSSSEAGHGEHFGHGTGHGIGLCERTRAPSLGKSAVSETSPCPVRPSSRWSRASTSMARWGVRIEDLVLLDTGAGRLERLTQFPREPPRRRA